MVNVYRKLGSRTGMVRALREITSELDKLADPTGDVYGSVGHLQSQIDALGVLVSGLNRALQGLQRLGLHDMTAAIDTPVSGSRIRDIVTLSGTVTDQSGHSMISGSLLVSGIFVTGLTFPASGYWTGALDTRKFANGWIPVKVEVVCNAGTSKESEETFYRVQNQIAAGGTTQQGSAAEFGDKVSLTLSQPGQVTGSFTITGQFRSSQGHALQSVSVSSNTSEVRVSATFSGNKITVNGYAAWEEKRKAIITVTATAAGGATARSAVIVYNPTPPPQLEAL